MNLKVNFFASMLLVAALPVILCSSKPVTLGNTDYSGVWKLNMDKSDFGNVPRYAAVKEFSIEQKETGIAIKRVIVNAQNEESISPVGEPENVEYNAAQTWVLENKGKELHVYMKTNIYSYKAVYDRQ